MLSIKSARVGKQLASYATAAAAHSKPTSDIQFDRLPSGLTVATLQRDWPVARVSLLVKAGSRHESHDLRGISHLLRRATGLATKDHTALGLTRSVMQIGAGLQCTATREHIMYSLDVSKELLGEAFTFLANAATRPLLYNWELSDNAYPYMARDVEYLHRRDHTTLLFEKLHEVAFGTTLGRSLYAPAYKIGDYSYDLIENYYKQHFALDRATLVASGVSLSELSDLSERLHLSLPGVDKPNDEAARFRGGELRLDVASPFAQVAIASEGAALRSPVESKALGLLSHVLGHGKPGVVWGSCHGPLSTAVGAVCSKPAHASAFSMNYSDSGLFGLYIAAAPSETGAAVKAARDVLVKLVKAGVKAEEVAQAKQQMKSSILTFAESHANALDDVGFQASVFGEQIATAAEVAQAVDSITADDVNTVAKKLLTGKAALVSVGNLETMPFLSDFA